MKTEIQMGDMVIVKKMEGGLAVKVLEGKIVDLYSVRRRQKGKPFNFVIEIKETSVAL